MDWLWLGVKALVIAVFVLALTEIAKRNAFVSAVVIAFPLMTVLTVGLLFSDTGNAAQASKLAYTTFWLIMASQAFFVVLYFSQKAGLGFWVSFSAAIAGTVASIIGFILVLRRFGINLLSNV
ncbi:MAG: hypothetical protein CMK09_09560 [Ponticaulis sp.]|nr:hypothetical protein [Ponticaulis sp.]